MGLGWGGDRSLLHYATHTYTHTKKTGHKLHFRSKLRVECDGPVLFLIRRFLFFLTSRLRLPPTVPPKIVLFFIYPTTLKIRVGFCWVSRTCLRQLDGILFPEFPREACALRPAPAPLHDKESPYFSEYCTLC